jgi:hypothetical protein
LFQTWDSIPDQELLALLTVCVSAAWMSSASDYFMHLEEEEVSDGLGEDYLLDNLPVPAVM